MSKSLYNFNNIIDPCNHDRLIIVDNCRPRKGDVIRKKLHWLFDKFGFKLDIQTHSKLIDYLDITLNLYNGTLSPFRKNNEYPWHINVRSNNPRQIFKHIPNGIMFRLSTNSSDTNITQSNQDYELTLNNNGYKTKLVYKTTGETSNVRNRGRDRVMKILCFTPPYNVAVAKKSRKEFFRSLKKNCSPTKNLFKISNKNNVRLSYSWLTNVANLIYKSNTKKLKNKQHTDFLNATALIRPLVPLRANANMNA